MAARSIGTGIPPEVVADGVVIIDPATGEPASIGGSGAGSQQVQGAQSAGDTRTTNPVVIGITQSTSTAAGPIRQAAGSANGELFITNRPTTFLNVQGGSPIGAAAVSAPFHIAGLQPGGNVTPIMTDSSGRLIVGGDGGGNSIPIREVPNALASTANTVTKTNAAASSVVLKASAGNLYGWNAASGASAGYVMFFDATTLPSNGTVQPVIAMAMAANTSLDIDYSTPRRFGTGIVMAFSSTGPYTLTASVTAHLAGYSA